MFTKQNSRTIAYLLIASCFASGCASPVSQKNSVAFDDNGTLIKNQMALQKAAEMDSANRGSASKVSGIWLGSKSIPLKGDPVLPEAFRVQKEFNFPGQQFTLAQAADKIYSISHIQVRISPDVARDPSGAANPKQIIVSLNSTSTTAGILDQLTSSNGLSWEYRDGVATIQRLVTRTFVLKSTPGTNTYSFSAGKTGTSTSGSATSAGSSGSQATGFTSTANVTSSGVFTPLASIEAAVKAVLTSIGKVVTSASTGSIVVIDSIEGVERAARIIERENEILTRHATFKIEILSFVANDSDEAGLDWEAIYKNISKYGAAISSPNSVVSAVSGSISMNVLKGAGNGRFDGTAAIAKLLAEKGRVTTVHSMDIRTRNLNVTPVSILNQTAYLAKTTAAPSSSGGLTGGSPGLEPGTVTTGFTLALQPDIMDSNQIALQLSVGLVDLIDIKALTSGVGLNQQSIEAPQTGGFEFKQDVFLKPYETIVLSGYERVENKYTRRAL